MDPITGALVVGGLVQAWNSEQARGASQAELNKLKDAYNAVKPPDYDLSISDPPAIHESQLALPKFSGAGAQYGKVSESDAKTLGQYVPQVAPMIAEAKSTTIGESGDMKLGREAQKTALDKFLAVGAGAFDPQYAATVAKAQRSAQGEAQSRQQSIMQDFARRGQGGSGMNLAAQIGGTSQAMSQLGQQSLDAAADSYRNRLSALAQGASLGGQINSQDVALQSQNAGIINAWNARMADAQRQAATNQANAINQGQQFNMNRNDQNAQWTYNQQRANATDLANWAKQNQQYGNQMKNQQYNDQLGRLSGQSSLMNAQNTLTQQGAADRNQMVSGLMNAGTTYYGGQQAKQANIANQVAADNRAQMQYGTDHSWMTPEELKARTATYGG